MSLKIQKNYTVFQFFFSLLIWAPIFYEAQKQLGLSEGEVFKIQAMYYWIFCLIEIPTGWWSDRKGHRSALILSAIVLILCHLLLFVHSGFIGFLFHWIGIALARSFVSGAANALLFEALEKEHKISEYAQIEGKARSMSLIGKLVAWAFAGWMLKVHPLLPYAATSIAAMISLYAALKFPKDEPPPNSNERKFDVFSLVRSLKGEKQLWIVMLQGSVVFVISRLLTVNLYQPLLNRVDFSIAYHGILMSVMTGFESWGSSQSDRWFKGRLDYRVVTTLSMACALMIPLFAFNQIILTVLVLCLLCLVFGMVYPIQKRLMIQTIPDSKLRATFLSFESIINRSASGFVIGVGAGWAMTHQNLNAYLIGVSIGSTMLLILLDFKYFNPRK